MNKSATILVVEDAPEMLELIAGALESQGFAVVRARNLADLRRCLPWAKADVILLDINLPKVNGLEVLRQLKAHERFRRIPVVILTSSREDKDLNTAYDLGVNSYIEKPVSFNKFMDVAEQIELYWCVLNERPF